MAKKRKPRKTPRGERPERAKLSPELSMKRLQEFPQRKEEFIAAVRKGED